MTRLQREVACGVGVVLLLLVYWFVSVPGRPPVQMPPASETASITPAAIVESSPVVRITVGEASVVPAVLEEPQFTAAAGYVPLGVYQAVEIQPMVIPLFGGNNGLVSGGIGLRHVRVKRHR